MSKQFRLDIPRQAKRLSLGLILLLILVTIGFRVWVLASSLPSSTASIFNQAAERSGTNQPLSTQNLSHLHPLWTYTFALDVASDMAVANGVIYTINRSASGDVLVAIQNGKQAWRYQMPDSAQRFARHFQVDGDTVYVAMNTNVAPYTNNTIYAVNAHTGQERWHYSSEASMDQLAHDDAFLYFSTNRQVYALAATTGTLQWSYQYSDGAPYSSFLPSLATNSGKLYLGLWTSPYRVGTSLAAVNGRTGRVQWQMQEMGAQTLSLLVENGVLYRQVEYSAYVPTTKTGESPWHTTYKGSALNATTGKELWQNTMGLSRPRLYGIDTAHNLLYTTGPKPLQAFDLKTGQLVWDSGSLMGNVSIDSVVSNGVIYVATEIPVAPYRLSLFDKLSTPPQAKYWLYALDAQSGKLLRVLQDGDSSYKLHVLKADKDHLYVLGGLPFPVVDETAKGKPEIYVLGV